MTLVKVKDRYGNKFYVTPEDLNGGRTQLRLYHPRTKERFSEELGDNNGTSIHRGNICIHPRRSFVSVNACGDTWKICPVCAGPDYLKSMKIVSDHFKGHIENKEVT